MLEPLVLSIELLRRMPSAQVSLVSVSYFSRHRVRRQLCTRVVLVVAIIQYSACVRRDGIGLNGLLPLQGWF